MSTKHIMKTTILYYILFALIVMTVLGKLSLYHAHWVWFLVHGSSNQSSPLQSHPTISGQEDSDDDLEDFDLDDDRYLLRARPQNNKKNSVEAALAKELKKNHRDYHHYDFLGVEIFCLERNSSNRKQQRDMQDLEKEIQRIAQKKGLKRGKRQHTDYHAFRLFGCQVFCPEDICDMWRNFRSFDSEFNRSRKNTFNYCLPCLFWPLFMMLHDHHIPNHWT